MKKKRDKYSPLIYWTTKRICHIMGRIQQNLRYYCPPEVKKLRAPFIVCSNHAGLWDPFFLCHPFRNGLRYITSDAAFRSRAKGWLLGKLGCVPKTKGVRDSETIRFLFEVIGKRQCIGGNVPAALFAMGTPEEMDAYVKGLLETTAQDGGFILSSGIVLDEADPAAYHAFIEAGRKYGT